MHACRGTIYVFCLVLLTCSSGCIEKFYEKPALPTETVTPTYTIQTESPISTVSPSEMALQKSDLPEGYFLRDRSVIPYEEEPKINRDLGWRQGYRVEFYRMNLGVDDLTGITQTIGIYPLDNMNKLYSVEREALLQEESPIEKYEIPFPVIGDKSIAVRMTNPEDPYKVVTYTVLFENRNVFEKITMTGSTTDYEILKDIAKKASTQIR